MATVPQSPWFCSVKPFKSLVVLPSINPNHRRNSTFKTLRASSAEQSSSSNSANNNNNNSSEPIVTDPVKLAFEKAKAYKRLKQESSASIGKIVRDPVTELPNSTDNFFKSGQTDPLKLAVENIKDYTESNTQNPVPNLPNLSNDSLQSRQTDSLRLAIEEIKGYEKSRESNAQNPVLDLPNLSNDSLQARQTDSLGIALEEIKGYEKSREPSTQNPVPDLPNLSNDSLQSRQTDSSRLALEEIKSYEKLRESSTQNPVPGLPSLSNNSLQSRQTDSLRLALEEIKGFEKSRESNTQKPVPDLPNLINDSLQSRQTDSLRSALEEIKGYEKSKESNTKNPVPESAKIGQENGGSNTKEVPMAVKLALERAREYKQKKDIGGSTKTVGSGLKAENREKQSDPIIQNRRKKKDDPKISSIDFAGLDFADKKQGRELPAGLAPRVNPFAEGELPEVEIIVGDQSKFGNRATSNPKKNVEDQISDIYEPTVSTWGVFPRPRNISKTYGGGKVINPGDVLQTEEENAAKVNRARQLVAAYRNRVTLKIDPKVKSECEKDLKDGDSLMDQGSLKQALPFYQRIMDKLPFETELHGLAALQWSICQDSLLRSSEARVMYEKLQSHPKAHINKKAKDFMFTFQAMEMMKVKSLDLSKPSSEYQNYFEAFVEDKSITLPLINKTEESEVDDPMNQALPYIIFLFSPIFFVLFIALQKVSRF